MSGSGRETVKKLEAVSRSHFLKMVKRFSDMMDADQEELVPEEWKEAVSEMEEEWKAGLDEFKL